GDNGQVSSAAAARFEMMARNDPSQLVRLFLASALQRMGKESRWGVAERLLGHGEDAQDANIPQMIWYGFEPLVGADPARALKLAAAGRIPLIREQAARRVAG